MSDEKSLPQPESDPIVSVSDTKVDPPAFKADDFLAKNTASQSVKPDAKPHVIKRGGVSFFTALAMSTLATAGGAYLALFMQARPDVLQQVGIGQFLPKSPPTSQGAIGADAALVDRVRALETQMAALSVRIAGVEPKSDGNVARLPAPPSPVPADSAAPNPPATIPAPPPVAINPSDVGILKSELAGIGGRVTAIETRLAALDPTGAGGAVIAGLQAEVAALKATINALQQQVAAAPSPAVTMAMVNLVEATGRSGPFLTEFETLRGAMGNGPELAGLEAYARTGVPTRAMLQDRFSALGPALTAAQEASKKEGGLVMWIRSFFTDMVKVTPAPNARGDGAVDILARAKSKLDQGDLSGSIDDLAAIPTPPAAVSEWIASARKRLDLESRLSSVRAVASKPQVVLPIAPPVTTGVGAQPSATPQPITPPAAPVEGKNP